MGDPVVLFSEEDTMFRMMEAAVNGEPSQKALDALHYFFGDDIDRHLKYLTSLPATVGMPMALQGIICKDEGMLPDRIADADYLVCERAEVSRETMQRGAKRLKFIQKFGSDYKNIDIKAAHELGIPVAYLRRVSTISVKEHVLALIFALSRNILYAHGAAKRRKDANDGLRSEGPPRTKFNWGQVAMAAYAVGMKIMYFQRHRASAEREAPVQAQFVPSLEELVQKADFVSIHVPYGPATEKMFNRKILSQMKPTAFLISTSRGGIIDEEALYEVLSQGKIAGAALDVYRWEPVPSDCPLLDLDNILWATHNAGGIGEFLLQEVHDVLANIARVIRKERPEYLIENA